MLGCNIRIADRTKEGCTMINVTDITDTFDRKVDTKLLRFFSTEDNDNELCYTRILIKNTACFQDYFVFFKSWKCDTYSNR